MTRRLDLAIQSRVRRAVRLRTEHHDRIHCWRAVRTSVNAKYRARKYSRPARKTKPAGAKEVRTDSACHGRTRDDLEFMRTLTSMSDDLRIASQKTPPRVEQGRRCWCVSAPIERPSRNFTIVTISGFPRPAQQIPVVQATPRVRSHWCHAPTIRLPIDSPFGAPHLVPPTISPPTPLAAAPTNNSAAAPQSVPCRRSRWPKTPGSGMTCPPQEWSAILLD